MNASAETSQFSLPPELEASAKDSSDLKTAKNTANNKARYFSIHGSNTVGAELMPRLLETYARTQQAKLSTQTVDKNTQRFSATLTTQTEPLFEIDLYTQGSSTAFSALAKGEATMGMASREVNSTEIKQLKKQGIRGIDKYGSKHVLALDALAVIVSPKHALKTLSLSQLADIFSGKISSWKALGEKDKKINLYLRDAHSGTYDTFERLVLKPKKYKLSKTAQRFDNNQALTQAVLNDPHGIGITSFNASASAKVIAIGGECGIANTPSEFLIRAEEYPLSRRLFLYTHGEPQQTIARDLLHFALSTEGQDVVDQVGFVNQAISLLAAREQGQRLLAAMNLASGQQANELALLQKFTQKIKQARRVSVTFRFKINQAVLDNKAREDIKRLTHFMQQKAQRNKHVLLFGFTDDKGSFKQNLKLSKQRAASVAKALQDAGVNVKTTEGYGELAPAVCNDGVGLRINRRVEVWLAGK